MQGRPFFVTRYAVAILLMAAVVPTFAQDVLSLGGTQRTGVAGQTISVPVVLLDVTGTPAGRDRATNQQIRNIAFKAVFSNDALVAPCSTAGNCTYAQAGIAPALALGNPAVDPCGALDGSPDTPCLYGAVVTTAPNAISYLVTSQNPLATTAAPGGNLIGYLRLKLASSFPAGGNVTVSLSAAEAFVSGSDLSTAETVARGTLTVASFRPGDADNNGAVTSADLTTAVAAYAASPGGAVTASNVGSDCDANGILTGADIVCIANQLNPAVQTIAQTSAMDVDLNGANDAQTDGILLLRYIFGFTGDTLVNAATALNGTRTNKTTIEAYLNTIRPAYDIDGNGSVDAQTDGVLLLRYIFGFTGDTLIRDAVSSGATRRTAAAIEAYLGSL